MLKRLLRVTAVVLVVGTLGLLVLYYMSNRTPSRYKPSGLTAAQIEEASTRVDTQKMPTLLNLASRAHASAASVRNAELRGQAAPPQATQPHAPVTVSFTQDEINSSLIKWSQQYKGTIDRYVTQPYVAIEDGQVILMGTVPELGRVVSMHLEPKIDDKRQLRCDATNLYLGSIPLPSSLFDKYREKVEGALEARMPQWRRGAKLDAGGAANPEARSILLSHLVMQLLNSEPGPAFLFLPKNYQDWSNTVPVRLTNVTVEKGALTITVEPTTPQDRAALAEQIHPPVQSAATEVRPQF